MIVFASHRIGGELKKLPVTGKGRPFRCAPMLDGSADGSKLHRVMEFRTVGRPIQQSIAPIPDDASRLKVLAWASTPNADGRCPTIAAIEERVREVKAHLAQGWTPDQLGALGKFRTGVRSRMPWCLRRFAIRNLMRGEEGFTDR